MLVSSPPPRRRFSRRLTQRRVPRARGVCSVQRMHRRLRVQSDGLMLLLELTALLPLLPLDPLSFMLGQHLFVLDPQLPALDLVTVQLLNYGLRVDRILKIGKGE